MRIKKIHLKNFRAFADTTIAIDPFTCLVGANGAGKSTVLSALNIFFRETSNTTDVQFLTEEDFHRKNTAERVEIKVIFHELSKVAADDLKDYVRNGELVVMAVAAFDEAAQRAKVRQVGIRMAMLEFAPFFKAYGDNAKASELKALYEPLRDKYPDIEKGTTKDGMAESLRAFEAKHPEWHAENESEDDFYGFAGNPKLKAHLQWVYIPAVKDASDEQSDSRDTALGKLLARTVRAKVNFKDDLALLEKETMTKFKDLMTQRQGALDEVSKSLTQRLASWSHPDAAVRLAWANTTIPIKEPSARVVGGEAGFEGDLARFGHGFQRSYLIALLQELSATDATDGPTLILGCEEPELYQHPPQARYLAQVLQDLSGGNAQIILTTHSPYFVGGHSFESVRMIRHDANQKCARAHGATHEEFATRYAHGEEAKPLKADAVANQINEVLRPQLNEMFFARKVILVEGSSDAAYIMAWMTLTDRITLFRSQGIHVVPVDGKSRLARPLIIAHCLRIPVFVLFDADGKCEEKHKADHTTDNTRLLRLLGSPGAAVFPDKSVWQKDYVQWANTLEDDVDEDLKTSMGAQQFEQVIRYAQTKCGHTSKPTKHAWFIEHKLAKALELKGGCATLDALCKAILV